MKTHLTIFFFTLAANAMAQAEENPARKSRERIQAARVAYITDHLKLTPEEAEKFWPVYREFTTKKHALQKQLREARQNPDPKKTAEQNDKDLIDLRLTLKQKELDLEKEYTASLLKNIPPEKLKLLPEAEQRFRSMMLRQIERRQGHHKRN